MLRAPSKYAGLHKRTTMPLAPNKLYRAQFEWLGLFLEY